jgi:hypothetical protein
MMRQLLPLSKTGVAWPKKMKQKKNGWCKFWRRSMWRCPFYKPRQSINLQSRCPNLTRRATSKSLARTLQKTRSCSATEFLMDYFWKTLQTETRLALEFFSWSISRLKKQKIKLEDPNSRLSTSSRHSTDKTTISATRRPCLWLARSAPAKSFNLNYSFSRTLQQHPLKMNLSTWSR